MNPMSNIIEMILNVKRGSPVVSALAAGSRVLKLGFPRIMLNNPVICVYHLSG